jgi:hypothetical protein
VSEAPKSPLVLVVVLALDFLDPREISVRGEGENERHLQPNVLTPLIRALGSTTFFPCSVTN